MRYNKIIKATKLQQLHASLGYTQVINMTSLHPVPRELTATVPSRQQKHAPAACYVATERHRLPSRSSSQGCRSGSQSGLEIWMLAGRSDRVSLRRSGSASSWRPLGAREAFHTWTLTRHCKPYRRLTHPLPPVTVCIVPQTRTSTSSPSLVTLKPEVPHSVRHRAESHAGSVARASS